MKLRRNRRTYTAVGLPGKWPLKWEWSRGPFLCFEVPIISLEWVKLFCSLAVLDPRVSHTMDVLPSFISVLCHSDWLFHGESCPRINVVHPGRAWSSSPACTWHCSLHYLFLQATPLFPHGVTIVCLLARYFEFGIADWYWRVLVHAW